MKIEIKRWTDNKIILCGEYDSISDCINKNQDADLRSTNLRFAKTIVDNKELKIKKIICLLQERYSIIISDVHIEIGCQKHLPKNWWKFTDEQIANMDSGALEWWKTWKPIIKKIWANGTKGGE